MAQADFRHGAPVMVDYTPGSNVTAGDVVLLGNTTGLTCGVAHNDITASTVGAIAGGGGVYLCTSLQNSANYTKVWWDDTNNKVTTTSTNNALFGFIVDGGSAGANTSVSVLHKPYV
jgi:predicted RecA/RadA family phage recombinase